MKTLIALFTALFVCNPAHAVPENQVMEKLNSEILPYIQQNSRQGNFKGAAGLKIQYLEIQAQNPKGVIILSPGNSEPALKYAELLYDLRDMGYSFFVIDHRGQGYSSRLLEDPIKSHVEKFSHYVYDFEKFVRDVVQPAKYKSSFILAHSMGGAIASGFLRAYPTSVTGAVLCAPMIKVNTKLAPESLARLMAGILKEFGRSDDYTPGQTPFDPGLTFEDNTTTGSRSRHEMKMEILNRFPELRVGGTTVNWVREALRYTKDLRETSNVFGHPTLLLQAGRDQWVKPEGQIEICTHRSGKVCRISEFLNAEHEILMETDEIRNEAIKQIRDFIATHQNK